MYLNDLNSAKHNVDKLNRILADTFNHEVDLSQMSTDSLNRMLNTTEAKMMAIKETDLKYWENSQYNKLGLIQHQLKTFINEIAPARSDGKVMKSKAESVVMENELEQAEVMLAAQELVDEMQKMVEDIAEMQVQKLMPIVDAMKEQVGFAEAEAYNNAVDSALGGLLEQSKSAKDAVENATLTARGEAPASPMPTDMAMDQEAPAEEPMDIETSDEFGGDDAAAGEDNTIGRELKGESALADMEGKALSEKKFLESKDRLFKMVESGKMTQEHFINIINQLDEDPLILGVPNTGLGTDFKGDYFKKKKKITPPTTTTPPSLDDPKPSDGMIRRQRTKPVPMPKMPSPSAPSMPRGKQTPMRPPNRFAPPPTGPGGDQALPRSPQPKSPPRMAPAPKPDRPRNRFAPPPTGPGGDQALPKPKAKPTRPNFKNLDKDAYRIKPNTPIGDLRPPKPRGGIADTPSGPPIKTLPAPPGLPGGDPLIHGGEPKAKPKSNRRDLFYRFTPGKPDPLRNAVFAKAGNTPKG